MIEPNDSDPEMDDLPSGAIISINTDGDCTYYPNGQFESLDNGEAAVDEFSYTIGDGNGAMRKTIRSATATIPTGVPSSLPGP